MAAWRMGIATEARMPSQARSDLADVIEAADALVSSDGDTDQLDDGCLLFVYIPLLLLFPTKRGGAGGRRKWARRFRLFWEGEWELLLREAADFAPKSTETTPAVHPTPAHPTHDTATQRAFMTAKRLVELGEFTRAAKKLDSTPIAPATDDTYAKLQALHPSRTTPVTKPDVNVEPEALDVPPKMLAKALRSAAKGAAPGPSGWRFEHLLGYLNLSKQGHRQGEEHIPFPRLIRRLLSARLPRLITKLLGTANLMALTKGPGKVRPVAVGDAVRRWVTRAVCMQHKNKMAAYFAPLQCAVGTAAGNEKLFKAAETFIESRREGEKRLLMGLDCTNAFNEVDRQAIVNELARQFPELFHFLWQFYGEPAELWYRLADGRVRTILSQQGTQQGDPAGPFLFCLALQPALKAIQASFPRALIQAFMDDIIPGADESEADELVDKAEQELQSISLKLARKKSKAYGPHWTDSDPPPDGLLPGFEREGLSSEGIDMLGGATGTDGYVATKLQNVLDSHRPLIERLKAFAHEQRQDSSLLFRSCAVPRLYYWLRLLPQRPSTTEVTALLRDEEVMNAAIAIHGLGEEDTTEPQRRQMALPVREGGMGITAASAILPAAYLGCTAVTLPYVWRHYQLAPWMPQGEGGGEGGGEGEGEGEGEGGGDGGEDGAAALLQLPWLRAAESAREKLLEKLPETEVPTLAKLLEGRTKPRLQHDLTASLMRIEADALLDEFGEESRDRARLRSCRGPGASGWLTTVPAHPGLRFTNEDFVTCCRLRIGATQHPSLASDLCSCGTQLDPYGDHLLCCGTGNERIWRHDLLCEEWWRIIKSVKITVGREVYLARLGVYPATTDPDGKRIDLYWVEEGKGMLGDVTIAHPTRPDPSNDAHHAATNRQNGAEDGKALRNAADRKRSKYGTEARASNFTIVPLSAESYGRWGDEAAALLNRMARHVQQPVYMEEGDVEFFRETAVDRWWARLSVLLQKGNAQMVRSRAWRASRWNGQERAGFAEGLLLERGPFHPR